MNKYYSKKEDCDHELTTKTLNIFGDWVCERCEKALKRS